MSSPKPIANSGTAAPRAKARLLIASGLQGTDLAPALSRLLDEHVLARPAVVLIEGMYSDAALEALEKTAGNTSFARLGFGCLCCIGSLPLRVTLTRILRQMRAALIVVAAKDAAHDDALAAELLAQFGELVTVEKVRNRTDEPPQA